jgi:peptide/nickel transport system permease protein
VAVTTPSVERADLTAEERYYLASQWQLMWQKFRRHRLAIIGGTILITLYLIAIFADFIAPYSTVLRFEKFPYRPPTLVHFIDESGSFVGPFIYGTASERDPDTLEKIYVEDTSVSYPIRFFATGEPHKIVGLFETNIHLFGIEQPDDSPEPAGIFLFGTDSLGRDVFSRTIYARAYRCQ